MSEALEKPKLFPDTKGFLLLLTLLTLIVLARVFFEYLAYKKFTEKPFYFTYADVVSAYEKTKENRRYQVVKLRSDEGLNFYTTSNIKEPLTNKRLRLQIFPDERIGFKDYLGTFYVNSKIKEIDALPTSVKDNLVTKVALQHQNSALQTFYNAIFFAIPLEKELREKVSMLGVSHLVALSGFHLGILWGIVYGLLVIVYRPVQQKFFPYRYALIDVGFVAMTALGAYLWFVDFPPSLVRAFAMVLVGWIVLLLGMELLSFTFLTAVLFLLVALFASLLVSMAFWLSIAGVFYIFLLLQYTQNVNKWLITLVLIPVGIFILMLPIVHVIFGVTSPYQLLSPLLSVLFVPFYPIVMLLHLVGYGGVFDSALAWLFELPNQSEQRLLPLWAFLTYIAISLGAIWSKNLFYLLAIVSTMYGSYLFFF
jgi:competence protein ComEC